jgi:hypothetical protein
MTQADERPRMLDRNSDLFFELARESLAGCLSGLDFSAREFPRPSQMFSRRPLRDQHPPAPVNQHRGGDMDRTVRHSCRLG